MITYKSNNKKAVVVSRNGSIRGKAKGKAVITVKVVLKGGTVIAQKLTVKVQ